MQSLIALAELLVRLPAAMLRCVGGARRRPWIVSGARAGRQGRAGTAVTTLRGPVAAAPDATVSVLGVPIDNVTMDAACERIGAAAAAGRPHCVVFVNADCVNLAYRDPGYKAILHHADLVLPDGVGLKLGARLLGQHIRQNVNGTDLFPQLCATLARQRSRVYLLGARPGVADQVACWIRARYPGLVVAGTDHGYHGPDCTDALVARIRRARCQVLLVAFGAPHQERWLARHLYDTGAAVGIGVGGLFDFYSGRMPRAPRWLREIGGEWIYRLLQEPRRLWRRYLIGNVLFLLRVAHERLLVRPQPLPLGRHR